MIALVRGGGDLGDLGAARIEGVDGHPLAGDPRAAGGFFTRPLPRGCPLGFYAGALVPTDELGAWMQTLSVWPNDPQGDRKPPAGETHAVAELPTTTPELDQHAGHTQAEDTEDERVRADLLGLSRGKLMAKAFSLGIDAACYSTKEALAREIMALPSAAAAAEGNASGSAAIRRLLAPLQKPAMAAIVSAALGRRISSLMRKAEVIELVVRAATVPESAGAVCAAMRVAFGEVAAAEAVPLAAAVCVEAPEVTAIATKLRSELSLLSRSELIARAATEAVDLPDNPVRGDIVEAIVRAVTAGRGAQALSPTAAALRAHFAHMEAQDVRCAVAPVMSSIARGLRKSQLLSHITAAADADENIAAALLKLISTTLTDDIASVEGGLVGSVGASDRMVWQERARLLSLPRLSIINLALAEGLDMNTDATKEAAVTLLLQARKEGTLPVYGSETRQRRVDLAMLSLEELTARAGPAGMSVRKKFGLLALLTDATSMSQQEVDVVLSPSGEATLHSAAENAKTLGSSVRTMSESESVCITKRVRAHLLTWRLDILRSHGVALLLPGAGDFDKGGLVSALADAVVADASSAAAICSSRAMRELRVALGPALPEPPAITALRSELETLPRNALWQRCLVEGVDIDANTSCTGFVIALIGSAIGRTEAPDPRTLSVRRRLAALGAKDLRNCAMACGAVAASGTSALTTLAIVDAVAAAVADGSVSMTALEAALARQDDSTQASGQDAAAISRVFALPHEPEAATQQDGIMALRMMNRQDLIALAIARGVTGLSSAPRKVDVIEAILRAAANRVAHGPPLESTGGASMHVPHAAVPPHSVVSLRIRLAGIATRELRVHAACALSESASSLADLSKAELIAKLEAAASSSAAIATSIDTALSMPMPERFVSEVAALAKRGPKYKQRFSEAGGADITDADGCELASASATPHGASSLLCRALIWTYDMAAHGVGNGRLASECTFQGAFLRNVLSSVNDFHAIGESA